MSTNEDLDDLIEELGTDEKTSDNDENQEQQEVINTDDTIVDTKDQLDNSNKLVDECKAIYKQARENDLIWRYLIGEQVNDAYANENKYETSILKRLSEELDIAVSDLSRFRKFYNTFQKDTLIEYAQKGYAWSHFKLVNDVSDSDVRARMITMMEKEDEAPKTKELQETIAKEKEEQFKVRDEEATSGTGTSGSENKTKGPSPVKPVNAALRSLDKLGDSLADVVIQQESGIDFDSNNQEQKYNDLLAELDTRLSEVAEMHDKIFSNNNDPNDQNEE